jgi:nicotinamidase/pyrazinamidase
MNGVGMLLKENDALIVVDVQRDFLPGGSLAVPDGDSVVPVLNGYLRRFQAAGLPIVATRDWHPPNHCSFISEGGSWPPHCIQDTRGAEFAEQLELPEEAVLVSKATRVDVDAYSGFDGTNLQQYLRDARVRRVFIGGLATDYCVLATVKDALGAGFDVIVLADAVRAVNVEPGDGDKALDEMLSAGATVIELAAIGANG